MNATGHPGHLLTAPKNLVLTKVAPRNYPGGLLSLPGDKTPTQKPAFKAMKFFGGKVIQPGTNKTLGHA